jgi:hypothetical protein
MSISEVMLDRWLLEQIDEINDDAVNNFADYTRQNQDWRKCATEELSQEALDLL